MRLVNLVFPVCPEILGILETLVNPEYPANLEYLVFPDSPESPENLGCPESLANPGFPGHPGIPDNLDNLDIPDILENLEVLEYLGNHKETFLYQWSFYEVITFKTIFDTPVKVNLTNPLAPSPPFPFLVPPAPPAP